MATPAGYSSRFLEWAYAIASPLYDLIVWWGFLPLGGERRCRRMFVDWLRLEPAMRVVSLCCGTGTMERAILAETPPVELTGVDLGTGQLARARKMSDDSRVSYLHADATATGLETGAFDRVLISAWGLDREMAECGLAVEWHGTTAPDWIEAYRAAPR